ncbi:sugar transferase [Streptomyces venezuelae]|uniref:Sugar transferase n=1 Tax=Streptomyces venezuelae TaxID=54571 RepID=A0A5P2D842_STRVZ|nr:sugar transferase [Streptomyces venezuelae]QES49309.1 sugar transferase [Streptomyces venezuelae]
MRLPLTPPPAKRVFDLFGALALLGVLALPLLATCAALYAARGGRVFLREPAAGLGGRPFRTWRFRTAPDGLLGRHALDRLPQLVNVVRGEMSLVGPRPQPPGVTGRLSSADRLFVRPGITGLWQVGDRSDMPWEEMELLDRHYVENHWLGMDLRILARTPRAAVGPRRVT